MGHQPTSPSSMPFYQSHFASSLTSSLTNRELPSLQDRPRKRSPAHLSLCLCPTPSKRLKATNRGYGGPTSATISTSSMHLAARRSHQTRHSLARYLSTSGRLRRPNAEQWFDDSNQNPAHTPHASFIDSKLAMLPSIADAQNASDDPPFYLHDRSSSTMDSACAVQSDRHAHSRWNTPHPALSARTRSSGSTSTSEEFRGVIDDLTVKNQKLREKLKKYEKLHCSHLQEEKLFEVRVHGLPVQRKLELEHVLRGFAASLGESSDAPEFAPNPEPTTILLDPLSSLHDQPCSSSTSYSKPHDSTYASVSASGPTLNSQPNPKRVTSSEKSDAKRRDVKSYLHDIPPGLLPRRPPFISTKVKRKVVVRRLEQLFTGHGGGSMNYNQCHQQQEVSQSAAQVERGESGAGEARWEGVREARILPVTAPTLPAPSNRSSHVRDHNEGEEEKLVSELSSREGTPDQRPTRPLDLDLHRAQVPAENIQYIKHLGIASPVTESSGEAGFLKGWVYLNLLVGMAQLHTLNVTLGFIRKAIVHVSTKFELSADGRKIRWIGGDQGTPLSSDSDESTESRRGMLQENDPMAARRQPLGTRPRRGQLRSEVPSDIIDSSHLSTYNSSTGLAETDPRPFFLAPSNSATSFHYKPLIFRRVSSDDEDCYNYDEDSYCLSRKAQRSNVVDSLSGAAQAPAPKSNMTGPKEGGPIIFYKSANFCTDLSGDLNYDSRDNVAFTRYVKDPIGCDERHCSGGAGHDVEKISRHTSRGSRGSADVDSDSSCLTDTCLTLGDMSLVDAEDAPSRIKPIYFEASGLGGVQPQDNFCVEVKVQHGGSRGSSGGDDDEISLSDKSPSHALRQSTFPEFTALDGMKASCGRMTCRPIFQPKILSYTKTPLPNSDLPEPSYINLPFSSDNDEDDEGSSENSEPDGRQKGVESDMWDDMDTELEKPPMLLETLSGPTNESSVENWDSTISEDSDDSSIDILAHARVLDPETVAAREREYDSNMGMPLAEVLAGSSAATAGGGSGLPSEMSSSHSETTEGGGSVRPSIKRRRL